MREFKILVATLALALVTGAASTVQADPAEGLWQTEPGADGGFGHVRIAPCGASLCGTLLRTFDSAGRARDSEAIGRQIVWDMAAQGGGAYGGGKIFSPDNGKTYSSKMALDGDRLKVSGCVVAICRTQTWARVE